MSCLDVSLSFVVSPMYSSRVSEINREVLVVVLGLKKTYEEKVITCRRNFLNVIGTWCVVVNMF